MPVWVKGAGRLRAHALEWAQEASAGRWAEHRPTIAAWHAQAMRAGLPEAAS